MLLPLHLSREFTMQKNREGQAPGILKAMFSKIHLYFISLRHSSLLHVLGLSLPSSHCLTHVPLYYPEALPLSLQKRLHWLWGCTTPSKSQPHWDQGLSICAAFAVPGNVGSRQQYSDTRLSLIKLKWWKLACCLLPFNQGPKGGERKDVQIVFTQHWPITQPGKISCFV